MNDPVKFFRAPPSILAICLLYSFACVALCRADNFGDIWVSADAMYTGNTYHGYAEMRLSLENHSTETTHSVTLTFPAGSYGSYGNDIGRLSRSVTLGPQAHQVVTLLQPPLPIYGRGSIGVDVDGGPEGDIHAPNADNHCQRTYSSGIRTATVFISRDLDFDAVCRIFNAGTGAATPGPSRYSTFSATSTPDSAEGLRAEVPASQFSPDWLAYTPFDIVVLSHNDPASLSPDAAAALWNYVRAGGNLLVFGGDRLPQGWRPGPAIPLHDLSQYGPALGHFFVFKSQDPNGVDSDAADALRNAVSDEARYWESLPSDIAAANSALPLVQDLKIPTRALVFIMLAFIVVIGPVNLIVLNRRKRRTWMLWTIPAISLTTTLLVFAYSLLREGITPTVRIAGLTVLDQASHHAATIGAEGYYCPLTPSGGLHFQSDTEATPLVNAGERSGTAREVDWSQSQQFTRGWVSSRVPAFFHVRKSQTRRERLQVENKDGHLEIINGLGTPIKSVWFADARMNLYQAQSIAAGQTATLTVLNLPPAADPPGGPQRLLRDIAFTAHDDALDSKVGAYLTPNTYVAVLDGNPFLENALGPGASLKLTKLSAVVFGILDPAEIP